MIKSQVDGQFEYVDRNGLLFRIDLDRRRQILTRLLELKKSEVGTPELLTRVKGFDDRQHSNFISLCIGIEQLTNSDKLWANAKTVAETNPEVFEPKYVATTFKPSSCVPTYQQCQICTQACGIHILTKLLKPIHRMDLVTAIRWLSNCVLLHEKYNDDARTVASNVGSIQQRLSIDHIGYYRWQGLKADKIFSFWVRTMFDLGYWDVDLSDYDIPVDIHIARFPFRTRMIESLQKMELHIKHHRDIVCHFWKAGIGVPLDYDAIVWTISRNVCPRCNHSCELYDVCGRNFAINLTYKTYGKIKLPKFEDVREEEVKQWRMKRKM